MAAKSEVARGLEALREVAALRDRIHEFCCHMQLPKFKGEGNDYIQTQDVDNWLIYIGEASSDV